MRAWAEHLRIRCRKGRGGSSPPSRTGRSATNPNSTSAAAEPSLELGPMHDPEHEDHSIPLDHVVHHSRSGPNESRTRCGLPRGLVDDPRSPGAALAGRQIVGPGPLLLHGHENLLARVVGPRVRAVSGSGAVCTHPPSGLKDHRSDSNVPRGEPELAAEERGSQIARRVGHHRVGARDRAGRYASAFIRWAPAPAPARWRAFGSGAGMGCRRFESPGSPLRRTGK
jgi:hypothetical protein